MGVVIGSSEGAVGLRKSDRGRMRMKRQVSSTSDDANEIRERR